MRYGLAPSEIDHMPVDLVEEYYASVGPDKITFADEESLSRWIAMKQNNG